MPSQKILEKKQEIVSQLSTRLESSAAGVIADYRGLTVEQDTKLRNEFRKAGVEYTVTKNTMLELAVKGTELEGLKDILAGPTSIATATDDLIAPAKVMVEFAKKNEKLEIKGGFLEGKVVSVSEIKALADLPPREVLVAKALGGLNAPIAGFVNVLNGNIRGLVVALNAIAEQKSA